MTGEALPHSWLSHRHAVSAGAWTVPLAPASRLPASRQPEGIVWTPKCSSSRTSRRRVKLAARASSVSVYAAFTGSGAVRRCHWPWGTYLRDTLKAVTTPEIAAIAATLAARDAAARLRASERTNTRLAKLGSAAAKLARRGARHAWLFGSLARGDAREDSDVDFAVEGLPAAEYFAALAELMELFEGRVDLVRLEEAGDSLRACVREEGRLLP
jgi:uncharacterized protein